MQKNSNNVTITQKCLKMNIFTPTNHIFDKFQNLFLPIILPFSNTNEGHMAHRKKLFVGVAKVILGL